MLNKIKTYDPLSNFNKAINTLKNNKIRPTKQRIVLAKLLFEKGRRHISAEELYEEVKEVNLLKINNNGRNSSESVFMDTWPKTRGYA